jgi:hypothetical protein
LWLSVDDRTEQIGFGSVACLLEARKAEIKQGLASLQVGQRVLENQSIYALELNFTTTSHRDIFVEKRRGN